MNTIAKDASERAVATAHALMRTLLAKTEDAKLRFIIGGRAINMLFGSYYSMALNQAEKSVQKAEAKAGEV